MKPPSATELFLNDSDGPAYVTCTTLKKKKLKLNQSVSLTVTSVVDFQKQNPTLPNPIPQVTNPEYDVLWYP